EQAVVTRHGRMARMSRQLEIAITGPTDQARGRLIEDELLSLEKSVQDCQGDSGRHVEVLPSGLANVASTSVGHPGRNSDPKGLRGQEQRARAAEDRAGVRNQLTGGCFY